MQVFATIKIRMTSTGFFQEEGSALELARQRLEGAGFEVLFVGHDTLDVEATEERFERVLGVPPPGPEGMSSKVSPRDHDLRRLVELVEVYPLPQYAI